MIILINGIINSGKSTCAKMLAERIENAAVVEPDVFFNFFTYSEDPQVRNRQIVEIAPLCWQNAICTMQNLINHNYNVIVPYPLYKKQYHKLLETFQDSSVPIHFITLEPSIEVALGTRSKRHNEKWERTFIEWQISIGIAHPNEGVVIDNTNLSPGETAEKVLSLIENETAQVHLM